jgi:hypothetical protein
MRFGDTFFEEKKFHQTTCVAGGEAKAIRGEVSALRSLGGRRGPVGSEEPFVDGGTVEPTSVQRTNRQTSGRKRWCREGLEESAKAQRIGQQRWD